MITVHHLKKSRSHRILWILEELQLEYEIKTYDRDTKTMLAPDSLKKVHPLGKSPLISHKGTVVAESGAIIEYLLDLKSDQNLRPEHGTEEHRRFTFWMHYAEGSLMPPLLLSLVFSQLGKSPAPLPLRPVGMIISKAVHDIFISNEIAKHASFVEGELEKHEWLAGDQFSACDIQTGFVLEALASRTDISKYPKIGVFLERIRHRAAYKKAIEIGGPVLI